MNITTYPLKNTPSTSMLYPDCSQSTAVTHVCIVLRGGQSEHGVIVHWASGDKWVYLVPTDTIIANLGLESVGQFANAMKNEARFSTTNGMPVVA